MRISTFFFLTRRGIRNLGKHWAMTIACIGSLTVCLFLNGFAQLAESNLDSLVNYLGKQNETVVWLDPDCPGDRAEAISHEIIAMPGVSGITYVSKEDVLETYRGYMEEYASLWDEFENDNPFKASYRVSVSDLSRLPEISRKLEKIPNVVKVTAPTELSSIFITIQNGVSRVEKVFVIILMVVSIITVGSTIRLSVFARRQEIEIMKYVGATNRLVCWPFFVEGMLLGLIAGGLGAGATLGLYYLLINASANLNGIWLQLFSLSMIPMELVWKQILTSSLLAGAIIGGIGSLTSIRKHLNV